MLKKSLGLDSQEGYLPDVGMCVDPKEGSLFYGPKSYVAEGERGKERGVEGGAATAQDPQPLAPDDTSHT